MKLAASPAFPLILLLVVACGPLGSRAGEDKPAQAGGQAPAPQSPVSPERSLQYFRLAPGLRMELVASEPEVVDPVALRFDEDGRLWVVEMRDYPHGPAEDEEPLSRIRVLEDRNGDGRYESSRVFADKLLFPTGVQPWGGGLIVTLAGQVAYLKDTTGDGRADQQETWFTGFVEENPQLRANHPRLGLDNHIYIANGLRGGSIVDTRQPDSQPVPISGMDFRFHPRTGRFEAVTGMSQFGLTFDDFGNRFVCSNRNPLKHIVLEDRYIGRKRSLALPAAAHDVALPGEQSRVFPIGRAWTTSTQHAGQFTAACGVHIYRGDAMPDAFYGNAFTCEPTGNLVHREVLRPAGATFQSTPAREGIEFLASYDPWFSPVNVESGPDGALYIIDMYRAVIEHPQFMPEELQRRPDLRDGDDRGRIYRIVSDVPAPAPKRPQLSQAGTGELVELLEHPNAWWRETAARLLVERQDQAAGPPLEQLAAESPQSGARVAALWILEGLGGLSVEQVQTALRDPHPGVRQQAVVLSEPRLDQSSDLRRQLLELARDEDARVRFQVALSLSPITSPAEVEGLQQIALRGADDVWTRRAVAIATGPFAAELTVGILQQAPWSKRPLHDSDVALVAELASLIGTEQDQDGWQHMLQVLAELPADAASQRIQRVGLKNLIQALSRHTSLAALLDRSDSPELRETLPAVFVRAAELAGDAGQAEKLRVEALELLAFHADSNPLLAQLAVDADSQPVRLEAIAALSRQANVEPWQQLLQRFSRESPSVRRQILVAVIPQPPRAALLLEHLAAGRIRASELDLVHTNRLLQHGDAATRAAAQRIFRDAVPQDRQQVLAEYQAVLQLEADPQRGLPIFQKHCATCHRVAEVGVNVGPDIADSRTKTPQQLLTDILQPNRAIDSNYLSYSVVTDDGRVVTGILTSETASSITLQQPEGKTLTLLRDQIEELHSNGVSLMPDGLEKNISQQEMADLISFLKNWRYLDGQTPLARQDQ